MNTDDRCFIEYTAPRSLYLNDSERILEWLNPLRSKPSEKELYQFTDSETAEAVHRRRDARQRLVAAIKDHVSGHTEAALKAMSTIGESGKLERNARLFLDDVSVEIRRKGLEASQNGQREEALRLLDLIPPASSGYSAARANRGHIQLEGGDLESARRSFEEAIKADARSHEAAAGFGRIYHQQGNYEEAIKAWRRTLELSPGMIIAHRMLVDALMKTNRQEEAREACRQALKIAPGNKALEELRRKLGGS